MIQHTTMYHSLRPMPGFAKTRGAVDPEVKWEGVRNSPNLVLRVNSFVLFYFFQSRTPIIVKVDQTGHFPLTSRETDEEKMRNGVNEILSQRTILSYCESEVVVVWSCLKSVLTETLAKRPLLSLSLSLLLLHSCD